jgi:O-antigen/teichoic acid export membrane protein
MTSVEPGTSPAEPSPWVVEAELLDTRAAGPLALRGSVLRTVAYVLGVLISLISVRVLIVHLGEADFGRYVTVLSLVAIVSGFTEGGLNAVVLREFATLARDRRRQMMRSAIGIRLVVTGAGVLLAVAFAAAAGYSSTLVLGTALAGLGLVIQLLQSTLATTLQARLRFGWVSVAELVRQVINVALLVALVLAGAGLLPLWGAAIPAALASLAMTVPLVLGDISLRPSFHLGRWWGLLRDTVPWAVISAVNIVYFRVAIILMSLIATAVETGYFATSFRIIEVLVGIPGLVISAAFPILARSERDDLARFNLASARIFELAVLAGTWLVVCLEVGAPFAIHVVAGGKAEPSIDVLRIQGLALIATFVAVACGFPLLTLRRYRAVLYTNLGALVVSAALTLILVPQWAARGAAVAAVVAETSLAVAVAILLAHGKHPVRLPLGVIPVAAVAAATGALVGLLLPVHPLLAVLAASLVYFAALRLFGRFPREVAEVLSGWIDHVRGFRALR